MSGGLPATVRSPDPAVASFDVKRAWVIAHRDIDQLGW